MASAASSTSCSSLADLCGTKRLSGPVHFLDEIAIFQCIGADQIDIAAKQLLQIEQQVEVLIGGAHLVGVLECDQKIQIAGVRIERLPGCRAEYLQRGDVVAAAEGLDRVAMLFDELIYAEASPGGLYPTPAAWTDRRTYPGVGTTVRPLPYRSSYADRKEDRTG